jgi:hypothetical protein
MSTGKTNLDKLLNFDEDSPDKNDQTDSTSIWMSLSKQAPAPKKEKKFTIRVLPPYSEDNDLPYHRERIHYNWPVNGSRISGAVETESPAAELFFKVINKAKNGGADEKVLAAIRRLRPSEKYYYNVVDREDDLVKILSIPVSAHKMIMGCLKTLAEYEEDGTDPEEGRDIILKITGNVDKGYGNFTYTEANLAPAASSVNIPGWEGMLHNLKSASRNTMIPEDALEEGIPEVLGEHYEAVMELLNS